MEDVMLGYLAVLLIGALSAFYLDPDRGAYRRNVTRDRLGGMARRNANQIERATRRVSADVYGAKQKITNLDQDEPPANDSALAQKVMSELFRDADVPKGDINVNVADGVVYLRGQVERPDQIKDIEKKVSRIGGVVAVENMLHLADTPAHSRSSSKSTR
jgi:osmotically-inducible protein OsmY